MLCRWKCCIVEMFCATHLYKLSLLCCYWCCSVAVVDGYQQSRIYVVDQMTPQHYICVEYAAKLTVQQKAYVFLELYQRDWHFPVCGYYRLTSCIPLSPRLRQISVRKHKSYPQPHLLFTCIIHVMVAWLHHAPGYQHPWCWHIYHELFKFRPRKGWGEWIMSWLLDNEIKHIN